MAELSHLDAAGHAHMVDVGGKAETARQAVATGHIAMNTAALAAVRAGTAPKGDVLAAARIAGIMAAKRTHELIPLCHPLALSAVALDLALTKTGITATATVGLTARTGAEMEAMTAVCVALLTIYDMAKALDKAMVMSGVHLVSKMGGKSGEWHALAQGDGAARA